MMTMTDKKLNLRYIIGNSRAFKPMDKHPLLPPFVWHPCIQKATLEALASFKPFLPGGPCLAELKGH